MSKPTPLLYETHSHTTLCGHALGELHEYAEVALARNLRGYTITCHNPMPDRFGHRVRMEESQFPLYLEMVAATREAFAGQLDVLLGLECDYFPGFEAYLERQLQSEAFHYVLGSVHPQQKEWRERFAVGAVREVQVAYFDQLAEAAETKLFDSISHPDLIKNLTVNDWDLDAIWDDILRTLDRIATTGVALELNTSGAYKAIREMNPTPRIIEAARERDIPFVVGADAHQPGRVGDRFVEALELLNDCGYSHVSYFRDRQRQALAIDEALPTLCDPSEIEFR
ncbi:MAG: histidinol-phosphatase [Planctomycetota bacterium]